MVALGSFMSGFHLGIDLLCHCRLFLGSDRFDAGGIFRFFWIVRNAFSFAVVVAAQTDQRIF